SAGRLHHALLFSGTRGVGKTTLARIIAKCLNCERVEDTTAQPCSGGDDACAACREIDEGRFIDLIEVDAASRTGVDDTRELMDNVHYAPTRGRTKVYLIDEVHMLSKHSFNALLKTLEEPPPRIQFLFATTEPEKLPITILSRCLQFPLKRLPVPEITGQLCHIMDTEQQQAEQAGADDIARAADGSMRDALSLLDQAIAVGSAALTSAAVRDMLGTVGQTQIRTLIEAVAAADARAALDALEAAFMQGMVMRYLLQAVATAWHEIATQQVLALHNDDTDGANEWADVAGRTQAGDIQLYYDITLSGLRDLAHAPDPLVGARMTLLRMLAFTPAGGNGPTPQQDGARSAAPVAQDRQSSSQSTTRQTPPAQAQTDADAPPEPAAEQAPTGEGEMPAWHELVQRMNLSGLTRQLVDNSVCRDLNAQAIQLELARAHEHLATESARGKLQQALAAQWRDQTAPHLRIRIVDQVADTPAHRAQQAAEARQQEAIRSIENDPTVQELQDRLGAELRTHTITPHNSA